MVFWVFFFDAPGIFFDISCQFDDPFLWVKKDQNLTGIGANFGKSRPRKEIQTLFGIFVGHI